MSAQNQMVILHILLL